MFPHGDSALSICAASLPVVGSLSEGEKVSCLDAQLVLLVCGDVCMFMGGLKICTSLGVAIDMRRG